MDQHYDTASKTLPLTVPASSQQQQQHDGSAAVLAATTASYQARYDCPEGMRPALILLGIATIVIVILLTSKHPISS